MLSQSDISQLRRLMEARDKRDELKKALTEAEREFREAEADLFDKLTDPDTGDIRRIPPVDLGPPWGRVAFTARETYYGRVIPGKEQEALEYYRERHLLDQMAAPKFVMKRINEEVRDCIEQGKELPPGLDFYANRGVTITREKN